MSTSGGIVDVSAKPNVARRAIAEGTLRLRPATVSAIRDGSVPKGDVLEVARAAAVMAVKETPRILPYCHPIPLDAVDVAFSLADGAVRARVTIKTQYRTGVEMEALTGTTVALLTAWDLVKPLEKDEAGQYPEARITDVRVVEKVKG